MKEEVKYVLDKFNDAFSRLKEGALQAKDELGKDGVIQRFEFTFELLWKSLKVFLEYEGIECRTPRECLKSAFRIGIIEDEQVFLDMLEDRNKTSHIYDKEESEKIFRRIKNDYLPQIEKVWIN
jgi:nucleotidyltransferase substrate binding protein (TIGR01987 family)